MDEWSIANTPRMHSQNVDEFKDSVIEIIINICMYIKKDQSDEINNLVRT